MSTISLTVIEGSMALPNQRPLGRLPTPFGSDWMLLPPHFSWRAELKALYCALLHTFCMNNEAFLSLCKWAPPGAGRDGVAAASIASNDRAGRRATAVIYPAAACTQREDAPRGSSAGAAGTAGTAATAPIADAPVFAARARRAPTQWALLTGGVWVVSAGALIAWLAYDHPVQRQSTAGAERAGTVIASRDGAPPPHPGAGSVEVGTAPAAAANVARPMPAHAEISTVGPAHTSGETSAQASGQTSTQTSTQPSTRIPTQTSAQTPTQTSTPASPHVSERVTRGAAPAPTNDPRTHRAQSLKLTTGNSLDRPRRPIARNTASHGRADHPATHTNNAPRTHTAVPRNAQRSKPAPSAAGSFSPFTPSKLGIDEYADITMSSATDLRGSGARNSAMLGGASPVRKSSHPPAEHSTEWMDHIGQRRVTEIPDEFAK